MNPGIIFEKIWYDVDVVELKITANDGVNIFSNTVYVAHQQIEEVLEGINIFKTHIYGGLFDLEFGEFGLEYANGAFHARMHFIDKGKIFITIKMQSDFFDFGKKNVASEATLYLVTEPALLDNFINELKFINDEIGSNARLECIEFDK